ncbi:MAG: VTT domain-containing protein [Bacteriovoracaceae bacterium]|nr:VTT domain-containing protein [Bacteroidota bacterium]
MELIVEFFDKLRDIQALVAWAGYIGLFIIVFSETGLLVGFFLPGDSMLFTAGLFAAQGLFNIYELNLLLIVAAVTGDATGYYIGKTGGHALYAKEDSRFFKKQHLIATKEFYEKYGPFTIVAARWMPFARTFAPVVAGIAEMSYAKFATYNIIGGVTWVLSMTLAGYFLGTAFPAIVKHLEIVIIAIVFLSILPGIIKYLQVKYEKK